MLTSIPFFGSVPLTCSPTGFSIDVIHVFRYTLHIETRYGEWISLFVGELIVTCKQMDYISRYIYLYIIKRFCIEQYQENIFSLSQIVFFRGTNGIYYWFLTFAKLDIK